MKAEKFKNLAENRVNAAIKQIRLIGNLSNKNNYEYNDEQIKKIFKTLENEVAAARRRFEESERQSDDQFRL